MFKFLSYLFVYPGILGLALAAYNYWGPTENLAGAIVVALPSFLLCWVGMKFNEKAKTSKKEVASSGVSKTGLFGAAIGVAAAAKANRIAKAPVVIAHCNSGGQVHGVTHVGGDKYAIYGSYEQQGYKREFRKIVRPGISGFNTGPADFNVRW